MTLNSRRHRGLDHGVHSTTRSLLTGLKAQDNHAWDRLVVLYTPLVYHWCQKYELKKDDIPDVIQEVFQAVSMNIGRFSKERAQDTFRGWLRVITKHKAMDVYRRLAKEVRGEGGTEAVRRLEAIPDDQARDRATADEDSTAQSILFRQALELIREEFKESTWRSFWFVVIEGRSPADVAEELRLSAGAVRVAKCRVLRRLRLELGDLAEA